MKINTRYGRSDRAAPFVRYAEIRRNLWDHKRLNPRARAHQQKYPRSYSLSAGPRGRGPGEGKEWKGEISSILKRTPGTRFYDASFGNAVNRAIKSV